MLMRIGLRISLPPSCSDEDDTAELLKELQKIRKERMEEQEKKVSAIEPLNKGHVGSLVASFKIHLGKQP